MNLSRRKNDDDAAAWTSRDDQKCGENVKPAVGLSKTAAKKAVDMEVDKLTFESKSAEGGERLSIWHDSIHFTLKRIREPEVQLPRPPKTFWGYIKWHLLPWTRPKLTP